MKVRVAICFALCGLLALPVLAGPASKADFAKRYAAAVDLRAADAESALTALQGRGLVGADFDLEGSLTYGDLVDIFNRAGIDATTDTPDQTLDTGEITSVADSLATQGSGRGDDEKDPKNNGRKRRPKGQQPNSRANPNAFFGRDEG